MPYHFCLLLGALLLSSGCGATLGEIFQRSPCEARVEGCFFGSKSLLNDTRLDLELEEASDVRSEPRSFWDRPFWERLSLPWTQSFSRCVPPGPLQVSLIGVDGHSVRFGASLFSINVEPGTTHYIGDVYVERTLPPEALRCTFTGDYEHEYEPYEDQSFLAHLLGSLAHSIAHPPKDYTLGVIHDPAYQSRKEFPVVPTSLLVPVLDPRIQCTFPTDLLLQPAPYLPELDRF